MNRRWKPRITGIRGLGSAMLTFLQTDEELLARFEQGEDRAFETLFRRHRRRLWGLAKKMAWDREQAEDILMEAMAAVAVQARRGAIQGSFVGYSLTAVHHRGLHVLERSNERKARAAAPLTPEILDPGPSPESELARKDLRGAVALALEALPEEQRVAVYLVDGQGLSYAEVGEVLACSDATVKRRLREARRTLAESLGHLRPGAVEAPRATPWAIAEGAE